MSTAVQAPLVTAAGLMMLGSREGRACQGAGVSGGSGKRQSREDEEVVKGRGRGNGKGKGKGEREGHRDVSGLPLIVRNACYWKLVL